MSDTAHPPARQGSLSDLAAQFRLEHQAVQYAGSFELRHAMAAGDVLLAMKAKVGHGGFAKCCETYFSTIPSRTLRLYMQLAEARSLIEANWQRVANLGIRGALRLIHEKEDDRSRSTSGRPAAKRPKSALPTAAAFNHASLDERRSFLADLDLTKFLEALPLPKRAELQRRAQRKDPANPSGLTDKLGKVVRMALSAAAEKSDHGKVQAIVAINHLNNMLKDAGHDLNEVEIVINPARLHPGFERAA